MSNTPHPCLLCKFRGSAFDAVYCTSEKLARPPANIEELLAVGQCDAFEEEPAPTARDWVVEGTRFFIAEGGL